MLSNVKTFDVNDIVFSKPKKYSNDNINYKIVEIWVKHGSESQPLIVATGKCFSWDLQTSGEKFNKSGYNIPIVLKNKDENGEINPTEYQKDFLTLFTKITEKCKDYCVENREKLEKYDLERRDLKKIANCLYIKKEVKDGKQVFVENYPPTLYAKVIYNEKRDIITPFYKMKKNGKKWILCHIWIKNVI